MKFILNLTHSIKKYVQKHDIVSFCNVITCVCLNDEIVNRPALKDFYIKLINAV